MRPFVPLIANPHLATIASNFWPRFKELAAIPSEEIRFVTEPGVAIRVVVQRPAKLFLGSFVLVHGLEGSSEGGYMQSMAWNLLQAGYAVHRVNIRGCGGTEGWCSTLYHAGLTGDLRRYIESLSGEGPVTLVGYSLGGNISLKLAGEWGSAPPAWLHSVVGVSTPIDLAACVVALGRRSNYLYEERFVSRMRDRLAERRRLQPAAFDPIFARTDVRKIRTVFAFDNEITAPHFGFGDAPNYYKTQSSQNFLAAIEVPTLLLTAQDDPLVPFDVYSHPAVRENPRLTLLAPKHGGHVAFLAKETPRFWADEAILYWRSQI
ncbi:MAG TPA: alpha/beta fold hydrolase [Bryobacteraceae bacterium]|nr:alpha/beta fold hydrolase [Bryobacteraceae bacterium]